MHPRDLGSSAGFARAPEGGEVRKGGAAPLRARCDPFTVEIIRNALDSICEQMSTVIERTAYSTLIRDILDFSTALFDARGRIIAQSARIPAHLNTMGPALEVILERYLPIGDWQPGDVVLLNDPYHGGQHLPDIFALLPVFHDDRPVAIAGCMGHHIDIGGRAAGSFGGDATDIFQEGLRIPPIKLYEAGRPNKAVFDIIATNVREPGKTLGDLSSQVASLRIGDRGLQRLIAKYGAATIRDAVEDLIDYSETRMRTRVAAIPDGTYAWEDVLDDDGIEDRAVRLRATVTVSGSNLSVDFTGTDAQVHGPINCMVGMTLGTVYYVMVAVLDSQIPKNYGCYKPIRVIAPEGTLVNPRPPAPVVGRMEVSHRIVDVLLGCLAQAIPEKVMAPYYGATNHLVLSGEERGTGRTWVAFEIQPGGWGGRPTLDGSDGWSAHMHNVRNVPVEVEETTYPIRVERYEFIADSGGAGQLRGGLGLRRELRLLASEGRLTIHCDRFKFAPPGMLGGSAGRPARCLINPGTPEEREIGSKATNVRLRQGDVVRFDSQGGGGYGPPSRRDPDRIARDLRAGKLSVEAALRE
ncbi:MAG: hydantoinase B/oxoprolinase family protein [Candidatus Methylomirabilia bacterium]